MIKKFIFIFIIFTFLYSCGKKGDPEYKGEKSKIINTKIISVS